MTYSLLVVICLFHVQPSAWLPTGYQTPFVVHGLAALLACEAPPSHAAKRQAKSSNVVRVSKRGPNRAPPNASTTGKLQQQQKVAAMHCRGSLLNHVVSSILPAYSRRSVSPPSHRLLQLPWCSAVLLAAYMDERVVVLVC